MRVQTVCPAIFEFMMVCYLDPLHLSHPILLPNSGCQISVLLGIKSFLYSGTSSGGRLIKEYCPGDNTTNQLDLFSKTHELYIRLKNSDPDEQDITVQALRGLYSTQF